MGDVIYDLKTLAWFFHLNQYLLSTIKLENNNKKLLIQFEFRNLIYTLKDDF